MKGPVSKNSSNPADLRLEKSLIRMHKSRALYGKVDALTVESYLRFIYTHDHVSTHLDKIARKYDVTRSGINVLTILRSYAKKGCHQQRLSELLLVSRANVTGLVDCLIRKGFVKRLPDENDRRACFVRILPEGEKLLDRLLPEYHESLKKIFSVLTNEQKTQFIALLSEIHQGMGKIIKQEMP